MRSSISMRTRAVCRRLASAALGAVVSAILGVSLAGCASLEPQLPTPAERAEALEPMLSAAGFRVLPADTQEKLQHLNLLEPLKVQYYVGKTGAIHYYMADPYNCHCMYIGSEEAYQKYEQIKLNEKWNREEARSARENEMAAQEEEMNTQMEMFNPYGVGMYGPSMYW
jgi:hypothetical protein